MDNVFLFEDGNVTLWKQWNIQNEAGEIIGSLFPQFERGVFFLKGKVGLLELSTVKETESADEVQSIIKKMLNDFGFNLVERINHG